MRVAQTVVERMTRAALQHMQLELDHKRGLRVGLVLRAILSEARGRTISSRLPLFYLVDSIVKSVKLLYSARLSVILEQIEASTLPSLYRQTYESARIKSHHLSPRLWKLLGIWDQRGMRWV